MFKKEKNELCVKLFTVCLSLSMCFSSCSDEDHVSLREKEKEGVFQKEIDNRIGIMAKSLEWEESYDAENPGQSVIQQRISPTVYTSREFIMMPNCYIGGVFTASSVKNLSFRPIVGNLKPIKVVYTFPGYFTDEFVPEGPVGMFASLGRAINSPSFKGKQQLAFSYDYKEMTHYSELNLAFGAQANIGSIFSLGINVNKAVEKGKKALLAKISQKNFSVLMDYPKDGDPFVSKDAYNKAIASNAVYVNSVTYGRCGIITIESESSYEEIRTAFKAALSAKVVKGELALDAKYRDMLNKCQIKIFIVGGEGEKATRAVEGFNEFKNFIISGGEFSREVPGVPITFTANKVSDLSVYENEFVVQQ